jgi:hypothetical protein
MLRLIVETFIFGNGIVAGIGLRVWLSWNWLFGIFTQQKLPRLISEMRRVFSSLR